MRRLTAPTGRSVAMSDEQYRAWANRDLAPHLHREAYLHVLRESGLPDHHAESLYNRVIDPASWTAYPDTARVFKSLSAQGIRTAVVSNIAFDVRPAFTAIGAAEHVDEFVLSFEVGAIKPDPAIFTDRTRPAGCRGRRHADGRRQRGSRRRRPRGGLPVRARRPAAHRRAPRRTDRGPARCRYPRLG